MRQDANNKQQLADGRYIIKRRCGHEQEMYIEKELDVINGELVITESVEQRISRYEQNLCYDCQPGE